MILTEDERRLYSISEDLKIITRIDLASKKYLEFNIQASHHVG
jgi:hypothetical protein